MGVRDMSWRWSGSSLLTFSLLERCPGYRFADLLLRLVLCSVLCLLDRTAGLPVPRRNLLPPIGSSVNPAGSKGHYTRTPSWPGG